MQWKFIISLVLALLITIFALQNSKSVSVKMFISDIETSQSIIIIISAIIGALTALSIGVIQQFSLKKINKDKDKKIHSMEIEIIDLKTANSTLKANESAAVNESKINEPQKSDKTLIL